MAYKFFYPSRGETLDLNPDFKRKIDLLAARASVITFVGWRPDAGLDLFHLLRSNCQTPIVIEIFEQNCKALASARICQVICDDVRNFDRRLDSSQKELLVWQDGPEHLEKSDSIEVLKKAQEHFKSIVIATPDGFCEQDELYGNIHERHLSSWYKDDYESLGFRVSSLDQPGFLTGYWTRD